MEDFKSNDTSVVYPTHDAAGNPIPMTSGTVTISMNPSPYCECPRCPCCGKLIAAPITVQPYVYPTTLEPYPTWVPGPVWVNPQTIGSMEPPVCFTFTDSVDVDG